MTGQPVILPDQSQERFARRHIDGNTTTNFTLDNSGHMQEYSVCSETAVVPGLVFKTSTGLCFRLISRRSVQYTQAQPMPAGEEELRVLAARILATILAVASSSTADA